MIQVILLILKIIGITLAVLLGLILLVLALVLFVPVFYRVRIVHNPERTQVDGRVRFLFPLLSFTFQYLKKFTYKVRLFGYVFLDSERPKKEKTEKEDKTKNKKKNKKKKAERKGRPLRKTSGDSKPVTAEMVKEETHGDVSVKQSGAKEEGSTVKQKISESRAEKETAAEQKEESKPGFFEALRLKIEKIRDTITKIIQKIKKLLHQKDEVLGILKKPSSKQAVSFVWGKLKHLLKHILPRKIKGYVAYGADDPAKTGQALAVISIVYAKFGPLLEVRPNFEEPQLECDVELRGHIQLFALVVIALKVLMNPELREMIGDFKNLKNTE